MIKKHPDTSKILYFGPAIFTLLFVGLVLAALKSSFAQFLLAIFLIVYGGAVLSSAVKSAKTVRFVLAAFFAYWVEHLAYGLGFLYGVIR